MHGLLLPLLSALPLALTAALPALPPRDANPGCQAASFGGMKWTVENLTFTGSYAQGDQQPHGRVSFNLTNPALTYGAACSADSDRADVNFFNDDTDYTCTGPTGTSAQTTFGYDRTTGRLDVNQTWICSDVDPQYPTTIKAYGSANTSLTCSDETTDSGRGVSCTTGTFVLPPREMSAVS